MNDMDTKIKSVLVNRYNYLIKGIGAEEIEMHGNKSRYAEYDENGNEVLEINYTASSEMQDKTERKFDDKSRLTEEKYYDEGEILAEHRSFEYHNDKLQKEYLHYMDGSKDTISYKYNEQGFLVEKTTLDEEGYEERKEVFEKDNKDRLLRHKIYEEEELVRDDELIRDENGNVIESVQVDQQMQETIRSKNIFEDGKRTLSKVYDKKGQLIERFEYRYDGAHISIMIHETPGEKILTQFEYTDKGDVLRQEDYNVNNELLNKVERVYDAKGNITEEKTYINMQGRGMDRDYVLKYEYEYY